MAPVRDVDASPLVTHRAAPVLLVLLMLAWAVLVPAARAQDAPAQGTPSQGMEAITFDEAVRIALEQNTDLRRADNVSRRQAINVASERMDFLPDLGATVNGTQQYGRNFSLQEGGFINETSEYVSMGANTSVNLFNGFRDVASLQRARLQSASADQFVERTRQDVVFQVMSAFLTLVENRELVRVREEELEAQRQQLAQINELVEVGSRPSSERYQQEAAVASAELAVLRAERATQIARTNLIQVLALDPLGTYEFVAPDVPDAALAPSSYDLDALLQTALQRRVDLDARQLDVRAAQQQVRVARGGYFPRLDMSAGYGSNWSSSASAIPIEGTGTDGRFVPVEPLGGGEPINVFVPGEPADTYTPNFSEQLDNRRNGSVSLSLNIPIFDRMQTRHNVEQAQADLLNARYDLEDLQQDVALQVRQAYLDYETAAKSLDVTRKQLEAAERARSAAQERYDLGAAPFVELAQANADYVSAASERVRARYDFIFRRKLIDYYLGVLDPAAPLFD